MQEKRDSLPQCESRTATKSSGATEVTPARFSQCTNAEEQANNNPFSDCSEGSSDECFAIESISEVDRNAKNPSPPLEIIHSGLLEAGDTISGTAVTERWILRILMNLAKAISKAKEETQSSPKNDIIVHELDSDLESDFCLLWDSSVEKEVVLFLLKLPTVDIFIDALSCVWIPRLTEIIAGICGNMAFVDEACNILSSNEQFCKSLLTTLDSNDPPTLSELFRVYLTFLKNESSRDMWLRLIDSDEDFLPRLTFIACSSTNGPLLNAMSKLIDFVLEISDSFCTTWATEDLVTALLEAAQENLYNELKHVEIYFHILHSISTSERGKETIGEQHDIVIQSVCSYFYFVLDEISVDVASHVIGLASGMGLIHTLYIMKPNETLDSLAEGSAVGSLGNLLTWLFADHKLDGTVHTEVQYTLLEDSFCSLAKKMLSSSTGREFFVQNLHFCEDLVESLNCLVTMPHGKEFIKHLYSEIHSSQTILDQKNH